MAPGFLALVGAPSARTRRLRTPESRTSEPALWTPDPEPRTLDPGLWPWTLDPAPKATP